MYDEPSESPSEQPLDPAVRARDKADEFRMHAELAAVFEACRKFDAQLRTLDPEIARDVQRTIGKLEKSKSQEHPVLSPSSVAEVKRLLALPETRDLPRNDYHVHHRPGETMIARWLAGEDEVSTFYERLQAHFDAAMNAFREEERQSLEWKQDPTTLAYLEALDKVEVKMADRYLREVIRQHDGVFVLSTQAADEIDILHLCDYVMGVEAAEVVGKASAPPEDPTEQDRAWFFKLFSLRGAVEGVERMCFFTYLQKTDETF